MLLSFAVSTLLTMCFHCRRPSSQSRRRGSKSKAVEGVWWRCRSYGPVVIPTSVLRQSSRLVLRMTPVVALQDTIDTSCTCRRWSLNWDQINSQIVVGSCPRSASDVDRMVDEAGISAIICLQVQCAEHVMSDCMC